MIYVFEQPNLAFCPLSKYNIETRMLSEAASGLWNMLPALFANVSSPFLST